MADLELLDQSVVKLLEAASDLDADDIRQLIAAETVGKTRKGAIDGLTALLPGPEGENDGGKAAGACEEECAEEAPEAILEPVPANTITNIVEGSTLHLGDGRKIAFGECAEVPDELAASLRESGQAA